MKLKYKGETINAKTFRIYCGHGITYDRFTLIFGDEYERFEDLFELEESYPMLIDEDTEELYFEVDIKSGKILNCPQDMTLDCHDWKIVDTGTYKVLGQDASVILSYEGYVPEFLGDWGDYFQFKIINGYFKNWKFTQETFDELVTLNEN